MRKRKQTNYRNIWKKAFGPIPVDEQGMREATAKRLGFYDDDHLTSSVLYLSTNGKSTSEICSILKLTRKVVNMRLKGPLLSVQEDKHHVR